MQLTDIRIKLCDPHGGQRGNPLTQPGNRLKAFCALTFDGTFVIRDVKLIDGNDGLFLAMPSRKLCDHCSRCGEKNHLRARYCNNCGARLDENRCARPQGRNHRGTMIAAQGNGNCNGNGNGASHAVHHANNAQNGHGNSNGAGHGAANGNGGAATQGNGVNHIRIKLYADIAHPINAQCRHDIEREVVAAYDRELEKSRQPGYVPPSLDGEDVDFFDERPAAAEPANVEVLSSAPSLVTQPASLH